MNSAAEYVKKHIEELISNEPAHNFIERGIYYECLGALMQFGDIEELDAYVRWRYNAIQRRDGGDLGIYQCQALFHVSTLISSARRFA